jgi:hypothetical protein
LFSAVGVFSGEVGVLAFSVFFGGEVGFSALFLAEWAFSVFFSALFLAGERVCAAVFFAVGTF